MRDAIEYVRDVVTATDVAAVTMPRYGVQEEPAFAQVRRALFVGPASRWFSSVLACLCRLRRSCGRSVLAWSVLWQTA
ncbi:hypothetical protein FNH09_02310 [Streptomyces adustus]|uniref:Uncharacterized protein n=1 Tax=Streptomyces adustus TaxID=1609272 RepID=A0A5N8V5L9_9ACTN|nr:hypothetical protein [Streptomyces adustus]MPY30186.1 hypothetical protein [Streptomyces adustus]